jgi:hypothetical protein
VVGTWYGILVGAVLWCIRLLKSPLRQRIWAILLACLFIVLFVSGAAALFATYRTYWLWIVFAMGGGEAGYFVFLYFFGPYVTLLLLVVLVIADRDALDS